MNALLVKLDFSSNIITLGIIRDTTISPSRRIIKVLNENFSPFSLLLRFNIRSFVDG